MSSQPPLPPVNSATPLGHPRPSAPTLAPSRAANAASVGIASLKTDLDHATAQIEVLRKTVKDLQTRDAEAQVRLRNLEMQAKMSDARRERSDAQLKILMSSIGVKPPDSPSIETPEYALAPVSGPSVHPAPTPGSSTHSMPVAGPIIPKAEPLDGEPTIEGKTREAARSALTHLYGVVKFTIANHGDYPSVSKDNISWPSGINGAGQRVPYSRLDFTEPYGSDKNKATFNHWVDVSLEQGRQLAKVEVPDSVYTREKVLQACRSLYAGYKSSYKGKVKRNNGPAIPIGKRKAEQVEEDGFNNGAPLEQDSTLSYIALMESSELPDSGPFWSADDPLNQGPVVGVDHTRVDTPTQDMFDMQLADDMYNPSGRNSSKAIRSRKVTKCGMRAVKRSKLTGDNQKYMTSKYDTYFTVGAMSDDEEVVDSFHDDGQVKQSHYVAHPYEWFSDELIACRNAVESVPGKSNATAIQREYGWEKKGEPHTSRTVDSGVRTWMVKPDVLKANPDWLQKSLVYLSGKEWGEEEASSVHEIRQNAKKMRTAAADQYSDELRKANERIWTLKQEAEEYPDVPY
ncbi:hypothetical protein FRC12_011092 [Ceratobasidium sp. 428]|nr:hypothetical protein FRC12_011092 [Ceratobasidium sp. 428]